MNSDPRIDFVINQVQQAAKEIKPETTTPLIGEDERAAVGLFLKVFDRLLPMLVSAVIVEHRKQTQNDA